MFYIKRDFDFKAQNYKCFELTFVGDGPFCDTLYKVPGHKDTIFATYDKKIPIKVLSKLHI